MSTTPKIQLVLDELDLLLYKAGIKSMEADLMQTDLYEGARTGGSMGGHDPDFAKLHKGLMKFWIEKAHSDPHPFAYCVRHLSKHVADATRLCAWLKDQALQTTKWRKGNKSNLKESDVWTPSVDDLLGASHAFHEAFPEDDDFAEMDRIATALEGDVGGEGKFESAPKAGADDDLEQSGEGAGSDEAEGGQAPSGGEGDPGEPAGDGVVAPDPIEDTEPTE